MTRPSRRSVVRALCLGATASLAGCTSGGLLGTPTPVPEAEIDDILVMNIDEKAWTVTVTISEAGEQLYERTVTLEGDENPSVRPQSYHYFEDLPEGPGVYVVEVAVEGLGSEAHPFSEIVGHPAMGYPEAIAVQAVIGYQGREEDPPAWNSRPVNASDVDIRATTPSGNEST